jgi:hypothetical protein
MDGGCSGRLFNVIVPTVWTGHVARMGKARNAHRILMKQPEGKRPLGIFRRRCRVILKWICMNFCSLATLVKTV